MKIEVGKFYRTRKGDKARVYATDGDGAHATHGAVLLGGEWSSSTWTVEGKFNAFVDVESSLDLVSEWVDELRFVEKAMYVSVGYNGITKVLHREVHETREGAIRFGGASVGVAEIKVWVKENG